MDVSTPIPPGLVVVHGNRAELLLALALQWRERHPLPPLQTETWLVPSQAVGQWVRQTMAQQGAGIAAGVELLLPAQWQWRLYRAVLGEDAVPERAPLDEGPLTWRLWRLLPELLAADTQGNYTALAHYLADDRDGRRRALLAQRLADLFDEYQVYRPDWLRDWAAGRDQLQGPHGPPQPLPATQRWQAALWRAVLADAQSTDPGAIASRADVHSAFVAAAQTRAAVLSPRLIVFGVASLPPTTLEALALAARGCPVLVCVLNPCEVYWADMLPESRLLGHGTSAWASRQAGRPAGTPGAPPAGSADHGHPLLAAWGRQGRDFLALLLGYENAPTRDALQAALQPLGQRIDLFASPIEGHPTGTLLTQLQDDILHGRTLAETRARWPAVDPQRDDSLRFHICHTALRELEVLHEALLTAFQQDPSLQPRDILVMMPDVSLYAPLVHAVFGRRRADDRQHIPYTISDGPDEEAERLLSVVQGLCELPTSRLGASVVLGWLDVPAVAQRFGFGPADVERLQAWLQEAGVRWALDEAHRTRLGFAPPPAEAPALTWLEGLQRLWLGLATGAEDAQWAGLVPARGIAPLEAPLLERLHSLVETLKRHTEALATPATASQWVERLRALLDDFFLPADNDAVAQRSLQRLRAALADWAEDAAAALDTPMPLPVVAEAWLARAAPLGGGQRFMAGAVTFTTLMPMRAVPFRRIYLLGMNDGDYPRRNQRDDFDLTAASPRPGDRQRRHEDHYLFLEALLSAREHLSVSWIGRSANDDSERAASVLVEQLREHVAAGWRLAGAPDPEQAGAALLSALTTQHPLQAFAGTHGDASPLGALPGAVLPAPDGASPTAPAEPIDLATLQDFLEHPVRCYFEQRLRVRFSRPEAPSEDSEPMESDGLQRWRIDDAWGRAVLLAARRGESADQAAAAAQQAWKLAMRRGEWPAPPYGPLLAGEWHEQIDRLWKSMREFLQQYPQRAEQALTLTDELEINGKRLRVTATLPPPYQDTQGQAAQWHWSAAALIQDRSGSSARRTRVEKLLRHWVQHLAYHRAGLPVQTWVMSPRGNLRLPRLSTAEASAYWTQLLQHLDRGLQAPLAFEPRSALAWLDKLQKEEEPDAAWRAARDEYEGKERQSGVCTYDLYWARAYPDFTALAGPAEDAHRSPFQQTAQTLLAPLLQHLATQDPSTEPPSRP